MQNIEQAYLTVTFSDGTSKTVLEGTTLLEISKDCASQYASTIVAAKINNDIKELSFRIYDDCKVEFIDLTDEDGMRFYRRSLSFVLIKAVNDLFPERKVIIGHSIRKGIYFEIVGSSELNQKEVGKIEKRMREIVEAKIPFEKRIISIDDAKHIFKSSGRLDRFKAVEHRNKPYVTMYKLEDLEDYFYGYMVPDTGYLSNFAVVFYNLGLILVIPSKNNPAEKPIFHEQKKLFNIFIEFKKWNRILGVANVGDLNNIIAQGNIGEFIRIQEALHEKKIGQIADMISNNENDKKIVLIAGPSSSGKTTFAHRLSIQLRVNGLKPITISLDDYFVNREKTPRDEKGDFDFEALEAIDIELFNKHLADLIEGKEVEIPIFNFSKGARESFGRKLRMNNDQILVIEGIHGLNEKLTNSIPKESKFKVYVSALTSMNIDQHNRVPTTDARFIRRIVRDHQFRGSTAINSIKIWPSVRRGEEKNIFPFQENADIMFNSSMIYELAVLKVLAEPLLLEVPQTCPEYSEAKRLLEFIRNFLTIDSKDIPAVSIVREFFGGSCFYN